jgi:hypothetical protein
MTDTPDDTTDTPDATAVPPAQPDVFGALMQLLHLIGNASTFESRLQQLRRAQAEVEKAGRLLARERLAAVAEQTKAREEIDALRKAAETRQAAAEAAEGKLEAVRAEIAAFRRERDFRRDIGRYEEFPGGMQREFVPGQPRGDERDDPLYARPARPAEDESELVPVPGYGQAHTLTQSLPKPRRSMRRGQPDA